MRIGDGNLAFLCAALIEMFGRTAKQKLTEHKNNNRCESVGPAEILKSKAKMAS